ncbi:hypothetical protein CWO89_39900 [Bradyrhizobium sp. Leo170]|nr:hypothetical protein CWO90_44360 [Bradyrhizobium sp. Leo121]TAI60577.1 hypothetical protein CWO89_39900 [Bradyrhizobium sp. Leo170]
MPAHTRGFIEAAMFAKLPGFLLYLKGAGRQLTNQFRVAPCSEVGLEMILVRHMVAEPGASGEFGVA